MANKVHITGGFILFYCPGCKHYHSVNNTWKFNGDKEKPTFTPSVLVRGEGRCHLFVKDGMIQYLNDCTHELKGKIVPMEDFE